MDPRLRAHVWALWLVRILKGGGTTAEHMIVNGDFPLATHRPRSSCSHLWARPSFKGSGIGAETRFCCVAGSINPDFSN